MSRPFPRSPAVLLASSDGTAVPPCLCRAAWRAGGRGPTCWRFSCRGAGERRVAGNKLPPDQAAFTSGAEERGRGGESSRCPRCAGGRPAEALPRAWCQDHRGEGWGGSPRENHQGENTAEDGASWRFSLGLGFSPKTASTAWLSLCSGPARSRSAPQQPRAGSSFPSPGKGGNAERDGARGQVANAGGGSRRPLLAASGAVRQRSSVVTGSEET